MVRLKNRVSPKISLFLLLLVDKEKCPGAIELQAENKIRRKKTRILIILHMITKLFNNY